MTCPRCRADGHPTPITDDRCPRCGTRWARGQVGQMVATPASLAADLRARADRLDTTGTRLDRAVAHDLRDMADHLDRTYTPDKQRSEVG